MRAAERDGATSMGGCGAGVNAVVGLERRVITSCEVRVEVASVVRASDNSFRVAWTERHYVDNALATTERWSAILTIVVQPPTDAERLRKNPLGIYVHAFNWSKELG